MQRCIHNNPHNSSQKLAPHTPTSGIDIAPLLLPSLLLPLLPEDRSFPGKQDYCCAVVGRGPPEGLKNSTPESYPIHLRLTLFS